MNEQDTRELLIYMITSAAGLPGEPHIYGPLRMIEAVQRLASMLLQDHPEDQALQQLISVIEAGKGKSMTDPEGFCQMLQDAAVVAVDLI